jgi:hypothetical protein
MCVGLARPLYDVRIDSFVWLAPITDATEARATAQRLHQPTSLLRSLGPRRVFLAREPSRAYLSRLLTMTPKERAVGVARARAVSMYLSCVQPDGKWIR